MSADSPSQTAKQAVFKVADGTSPIQPVELGKRNGLQAQVLNTGDRVIVHPGDTVGEGVMVEER